MIGGHGRGQIEIASCGDGVGKNDFYDYIENRSILRCSSVSS
jgi:hypothetical protein